MATQLTLTGQPATLPYKDPETLWRLYHDEERSLREIADELDCHYTTVHQYMDEFGIDRRDAAHDPEKADVATYTSHTDGYEMWVADSRTVLVHRLVAVATEGFDAVCDGTVHHENEIKWDNRPANLTVLDSHREHMRRHTHPAIADDQSRLPEI